MALLKAIEVDAGLPVYYHDQMSTDLQKAVKLASEIEGAIKENQFELFSRLFTEILINLQKSRHYFAGITPVGLTRA
jgi:hypothetical protein